MKMRKPPSKKTDSKENARSSRVRSRSVDIIGRAGKTNAPCVLVHANSSKEGKERVWVEFEAIERAGLNKRLTVW